MGSFFQRRPVRIFLSCCRWLRITLLFALLLVVWAVAYLHVSGLPDYFKGRLLLHLREKGFEVQFSNMHLAWGPAILIDNVSLRRVNDPSGPRLSAGLAELAISFPALLDSRLEVESFSVYKGRLNLPLSATNGESLSLDHVHLELALSTNNVAKLRQASGTFQGVQILMNGEVKDFQSLSNWRIPFRIGQAAHQDFQTQLRAVAAVIRQIHFNGTPHLDLDFFADGADLNSLRANLAFTVPGAATPWGETGKFQLQAACAHLLNSGHTPFAQIRLNSKRLNTPWGEGKNISFVADLSKDDNTNFNAAINLAGSALEAKWESRSGSNYWVKAGKASWDGDVTMPSTNLVPTALAGRLQVVLADSTWGTAAALDFAGQSRRDAPGLGDSSWGPWKAFGAYSLDWHATARQVEAPKLQIDDLAAEGRWNPPQLTVQKLQAQLYQGHCKGEGELDVASRSVKLQAAVDFDPRKVLPFLTPAAQRWISQFDWTTPPRVQSGLSLVLPPWTNRPEGWKETFRDSLALAGDFSVGPASFRGVWVDSAASHFSYSDRVWTVTGLRAKRAEGAGEMDYTGNEETHEYKFTFDANLDPADVMDWLPPAQQRLLREVKFSQPPHLRGQAAGHWRNPEAFNFSGSVAATNFIVRGESVDALEAQVDYAHRQLRVAGLQVAKDGGTLSTPLSTADFAAKQVTLSNVQSTLDPELVNRVMGTNTPPFLKRLYFESPPSVGVSGSFAWNNPLAMDLTFLVQGTNFHWTNLTAEKISGTVHWLGRDVGLTNIQASLYKNGSLNGWISFDYVPKHGSSFDCDFTVRDINLASLAKEVSGRTNKLEGLLDGRLTLSSPLSGDKNSLHGRGHVYLHDALLWDIKMFGIFSPVLNLISPGAGNSRARSASAIFTVAAGEVASDDLEINATGYRLLYRGKVSMNKQLDARVEADLLRDTPVLGPFLSLLLTPLSKLFEYHVTGALESPKLEPVFVPKGLMMLLRPFHTLKSMFPEAPAEKPATPPAASTPPP